MKIESVLLLKATGLYNVNVVRTDEHGERKVIAGQVNLTQHQAIAYGAKHGATSVRVCCL